MGDFSYINIYATKGVEYLWIVGYLLLIVVLAPTLLGLGKGGRAGSSGSSENEGGQP